MAVAEEIDNPPAVISSPEAECEAIFVRQKQSDTSSDVVQAGHLYQAVHSLQAKCAQIEDLHKAVFEKSKSSETHRDFTQKLSDWKC